MATGYIVRMRLPTPYPASRPGLAQRQAIELVGEKFLRTPGSELQVTRPLARGVRIAGKVGVGKPVNLGVACRWLDTPLERAEQPGRVSNDEKARIVEQTGELADVRSVSG